MHSRALCEALYNWAVTKKQFITVGNDLSGT